MKRYGLAWFGALAALTAALRLPLLAGSFWRDEGSTYTVVQSSSLGGVFAGIQRTELTPPLYYLFEYVWTALAGTGEWVMRFPSLLFAVLTVMVLYALAGLVGSRFAAVAVGIMAAIGPVFLSAGVEARAYGLGVLLSAATLYFYARLMRASNGRERSWWGLGFVVIAAALEATQFTGFVVVGVLLAASVFVRFFRPTENASALMISTCAAGLLGLPLIPLFLRDSARFAGWTNPNQLQPLRVLDDHLTALSPFGSLTFQSDRLVEIGIIVWLIGIVYTRTVTRRDAWIALCAFIFGAGICVSIARHLPLERHLLVYAPALWLMIALLLDQCVEWIHKPGRVWLRALQIATALVLIDVAGGGVLKYPHVYARISGPVSGARDLVSALLERQGGRRTVLVALPDNVGPSLWYYTKTDRSIALRGVVTWERPQDYGFDPRPWSQPDFARVEADRIDELARSWHAQIALAITTHTAYFNGVPFYRARYVGALLQVRHRVLYRQIFDGWREPLELVMLSSDTRAQTLALRSARLPLSREHPRRRLVR